ncbi:hypothetical protein ACFU53_01970 [Streptomyces sp. NPDC057474]|uniref:hypothetical protein n=1 Tax=Streptomyces sp. NPDC057474 TaxID=3346144 RepID=UPI0036A55FF5
MKLSRQQVVGTAVTTAAATAPALTAVSATAVAQTGTHGTAKAAEQDRLTVLCRQARAEGGKVTVSPPRARRRGTGPGR